MKRLTTDMELADSSAPDQLLALCSGGMDFSQDLSDVHHEEMWPDEQIQLRAPMPGQPSPAAVRTAASADDAMPLRLLHPQRAAFAPALACVALWPLSSDPDGAAKEAAAAAAAEAGLQLRSLSRRARIGHEIELKVWPAAVMLARWLWAHAPLVRGRSVLEIGSGVGLAGLAAARCGAAEVFVTDIDGPALRCARENAAKNGLEGRVTVTRLDWAEPPILRSAGPAEEETVAKAPEAGESEAADAVEEEEVRLRAPFDVMVAADIVNADGLSELVLRMVELYLSDAGIFIMVCPQPRHRHRVDTLRALLFASPRLDVRAARAPAWLEAGLDEARDVVHDVYVVQRREWSGRADMTHERENN